MFAFAQFCYCCVFILFYFFLYWPKFKASKMFQREEIKIGLIKLVIFFVIVAVFVFVFVRALKRIDRETD